MHYRREERRAICSRRNKTIKNVPWREYVFLGRRTTMSSKRSVHDMLEDPDFKSLSSQKNSISLVLTILELVLYFGFIGLIAFNKPFLASKLSPGAATTIGIPIAVGTILFSWVFTGIYIWWANNKYDLLVKKVKEKIGG
jgi:uncharacterized membrane protein (DUF485 family)